MRFYLTIALISWTLMGASQTYVHKLAVADGEHTLRYFMNGDDEIIPKGMPYRKAREATRKNSRKPYKVVDRYMNGQVALITYMDQPDPISTAYQEEYVSFYSNGDSSAYYSYKKNLRHGTYRLFYEGGTLKEKGSYDAGRLHGEIVRYHKNGQVSEKGIYDQGDLTGNYSVYGSSGKLIRSSNYFNGTRLGAELTYAPEGWLSSRSIYESDTLQGDVVAYYADSALRMTGNYEKGKRNGKWELFHPDGSKRASLQYENDQLVGTVVEFTAWGDTLTYGVYEDHRFTGTTYGYSKEKNRVFKKVYANGTNTAMWIFNPDGSYRRVGRMTDQGLIFKCRDRSGNESPCAFEEIRYPDGDNLQKRMEKELSLRPMSGYSPRGVFNFAVDQHGMVTAVETVDGMNMEYDAIIKEYIRQLSWNAGSYYGFPAEFSNEVSVHVDNGALAVQFGSFYFSDSAVVSKYHVPYYQSLIDRENASAKFPGGYQALVNYLSNTTDYPESAQAANRNGITFVRFLIEPSGVVSNPQVVQGVYPSLDYESVDVIEQMPLWIAGSKHGRKVRIIYKLPFRFTLQ